MKKKLIVIAMTFTSSLMASSVDLKGAIEAQASSLFATADSKVASNQSVCFEFGKMMGLGLAYKIAQPGASLESYINETVSHYENFCKSRKMSAAQRSEVSQIAKSIFQAIND